MTPRVAIPDTTPAMPEATLWPALSTTRDERTDRAADGVACLLCTGRGGRGDRRTLVDQRDGREDHDHDDGEEDARGRDGRSRPAPPPASDERRNERPEGRRENHSENDRHGDGRDERDEPDRDHADDDQREEAHAPLGKPIEPTRNEVGRLVFRARIEDREQGTPDSQHDGNQGDRNEEADDARNRRAGRQRDQDERRMDADGLAVDDRAQDVAVEDVHDRDPDQQQDDRTDALRRQRHEDEDGRGDEPADVRDEPADEDHDGQRSGKRHPEQGEEDEVADPLDRGQHPHATQVASDPLERVVAGRSDSLARLAGRRLECPTPCLVAVLQEEERQEQREEPDRGHHRHAVHEGPDRGPDGGLGLRRGALCGVDRLLRDRRAGQLLANRGDPILNACRDLGHVRRERKRDEGQRRDHDQYRDDGDQRRRRRARPAAIAQPDDER